MYTININEETETVEELAQVLEMIANDLKNGMTSGYTPTWELVKNK